jgi:hypothetical protein
MRRNRPPAGRSVIEMTEISVLEGARNSALQSIGRNVVAFQKMEAMLKFLVANHKIQGLPERLAEIREEQRLGVDRLTMGNLVDKLFRSVVVDKSGRTREPGDTEGDASFSFSVELEAEDHSDTREAFQLLVQERNALIHQMLVGFNPNSLESCHEISGILADQRGRLKPHYEYLRGVVRTVLDGQKELLAWIESDDFPRALAEVQNDAD